MESDGKLIWSYKEAMVPTAMPKSLLVIGSGAIGIEFASFYRNMGAEVTVVEVMDRVLPVEDAEISAFARKSFEKASQTTKAGAQVDPTASAEIAALNVFVEKTQIQLRQRALWCGIGAAGCVLMDVAVAAVALVWLTGAAVDPTWPAVVAWTLRSAILAGLSFGLVYVFTALARLLFAEANAALEKRHSLGFGRLYVQMKLLAAPDPRRATRALTETELLRAFGWNPPAPPSGEEAPIRTLTLPAHGMPTVRTLGPARNSEESEPPP